MSDSIATLDYDQEAARTIGLSRSDLSLSLMTAGGGIPVGNFYDGIYSNNIAILWGRGDYTLFLWK